MKDTVAYTLEKGRPLTATIPATAGNVVYTLTPGSGYIIKILYARILLVCNATAGNRLLQMRILTAGSVNLGWVLSGVAVTASQTKAFGLMPINYLFTAAQGDDQGGYIPQGIYVYDTDGFVIDINGGLAGDSYSGYIKYLLVKR